MFVQKGKKWQNAANKFSALDPYIMIKAFRFQKM